MPDPGRMVDRVRFEQRAPAVDDYGNPITGEFVAQFERAAFYIMRPGSETVLAARLTGEQPVTIVVRRDSLTRTITENWRAVDVRDGTVFAIKAPPADMDRSGAWITITAVSGEAA